MFIYIPLARRRRKNLSFCGSANRKSPLWNANLNILHPQIFKICGYVSPNFQKFGDIYPQKKNTDSVYCHTQTQLFAVPKDWKCWGVWRGRTRVEIPTDLENNMNIDIYVFMFNIFVVRFTTWRRRNEPSPEPRDGAYARVRPLKRSSWTSRVSRYRFPDPVLTMISNNASA